MRKRGFAAVEIITHWPEIVGTEMAADASPEKLSFPRGARSQGTLHLSANGSVALELQHLEPVILERINTYFGYGAVARIALTQGRSPAPAAPKTTAPQKEISVPPDRIAEINAHTDPVEAEPLRHALRKLGNAISLAQAKARNNE